MLKVGGENVASVEIEGFLATHPKIKLSAVVGLEDEKVWRSTRCVCRTETL